MKQAIKTTRMITMGLFTLCSMGASHVTFAGVKTNDPLDFKFIGKINNRPVFQLNLNNNDAEDYFISIKDGNSDVLYSEKVKAKNTNFYRKYGLDIEEEDLNSPEFALIVEVTSVKTHVTQSYKVSSHRSVTKNIIVAEL